MVYKKEKVFTNVDDIVEVLDSKILNIPNSSHTELIPVSEFSECLSERKRITGASLDYVKLDLVYSEEKNNDLIKGRIENNYYNGLRNIGIIEMPEIVDIKVFDAKGYFDQQYYSGDYYTGNLQDLYEEVSLQVVFIKEDNGIVIDYFQMRSIDNEIFNNEIYYNEE